MVWPQSQGAITRHHACFAQDRSRASQAASHEWTSLLLWHTACTFSTPHMQVTAAVLKSGGRLECSLVLVGVGARPNTDLFAGQLELIQVGGCQPAARGGMHCKLEQLQTAERRAHGSGNGGAHM